MDIGQILSVAALAMIAVSALAADGSGNGKLIYRGFTVEISAVKSAPNLAAIESSVKHQIDIVADCGVKPEIQSFFRSHVITIDPGIAGEGGKFSNAGGVEIGSGPEAPEKPVLLHELLHAYHAQVMPMGVQNPDVLLYYNRAKANQLYPANEYLLANQKEFFAVRQAYTCGGMFRASRSPATSLRRNNLITMHG